MPPAPPVASRLRAASIAAAALPLAGCEGIQSALDPAGRHAREVADLTWLMLVTLTTSFVIVMGVLAVVLLVPFARRLLNGRALIIGGGVVLPGVVLPVFLIASLAIGTHQAPRDGPPAIEVVGYRFWWEMRYPAPDGGPAVVSANELRIPVGQPVRIRLTSADVIHSFWIPKLAGKIDMIPGQANHMELVAEEEGVFRGQCYEYCGAQHANMAFYVVAMPPDGYARWLEREARPAAEPRDEVLRHGAELFLAAGCGSCHTIRGTAADGRAGPDLTHVASRLSLAAGMLENTPGALGGWIASAQQLKPGNHMPSFNGLDGPSLRALVAYLDSLR